MKLLATLGKTAAFDLGERRNSPLLIAGAASEDAKLQCLKGLLSSLAANRSADEAMAYTFGDDAGRLRQLPSLPLVMRMRFPPYEPKQKALTARNHASGIWNTYFMLSSMFM